jgi:tocopherol O-methyltransferase
MNMNRALAQRSDLQPGQRVLDAGCGIGGSSVWLAKTYGMQVVGITPVASQVARARRHARQQGVEDLVRFDQQDYLHTTFPDESFDVVWALESVCHAPDKSSFLAEARRLLKPGGQLVVAEYFRTRRPCAAGDERLLHSWLDGWAIPDLATGSEFTAWTLINWPVTWLAQAAIAA